MRKIVVVFLFMSSIVNCSFATESKASRVKITDIAEYEQYGNAEHCFSMAFGQSQVCFIRSEGIIAVTEYNYNLLIKSGPEFAEHLKVLGDADYKKLLEETEDRTISVIYPDLNMLMGVGSCLAECGKAAAGGFTTGAAIGAVGGVTAPVAGAVGAAVAVLDTLVRDDECSDESFRESFGKKAD